jgi:glycosyltransferase involved in cell wall biosynthesis
VKVTLVCPESPPIWGVEKIFANTASEALEALPDKSDVVHFHGWVPENVNDKANWMVTLHGNMKDSDIIPYRACFVSRNHAERHQRKTFVYNGVNSEGLIFEENKQSHLLFFSKMIRRAKGASFAVDLARRFDFDLHFAGGRRLDLLKFGRFFHSFSKKMTFLGELQGEEKALAFSSARAMLFPIQWEEPFGLVVIESLMSGTPVISTPFGAIPELLTSEVGAFFTSEADFIDAFEAIPQISSRLCRDYALENFSHLRMAKSYLDIYSRISDGDGEIWE